MKRPTDEQIARLPKAVRSYLHGVERERDELALKLRRFHEEQAESPFYVDDYQGTEKMRRYVHGHRVVCEAAGVLVDLTPMSDHVRVTFADTGRMSRPAVISPAASNVIRIMKGAGDA